MLPRAGAAAGTVPIKPYVAPQLEPEPDVEAAEHPALLVIDPDVQVVARPWYAAPLVGALAQDAVVPLAGVVASRSRRGCGGKAWYKIGPSAYVCSLGVTGSDEVPRGQDLLPPDGAALPFTYVMVSVAKDATLPLYATPVDARAGAAPQRLLEQGDTVAVQKKIRIDGVPFYLTVGGGAVPIEGTWRLKERSSWSGELLEPDVRLPMGWTTARTRVFGDPERRRGVESLPRRTRVEVLEERGAAWRRMLRIGDDRWVRASHVNEVTRQPAPAPHAQRRWIDVDLGEQTLTAYEGSRPVFATLVSSGKAIGTPRGDYPIWAKASAVTMANQDYEDSPYFVHMVPWALFFQGHNALHGAYWHDRFGVRRSHGCVNLSPRDARWLFGWLPPPLPPGWMGVRPIDLHESVFVRIRDSTRRRPFVQERAWGPPDREEERLKVEEAERRRVEAASGAGVASPSPVHPPSP
jgi:hypothetical protein